MLRASFTIFCERCESFVDLKSVNVGVESIGQPRSSHSIFICSMVQLGTIHFDGTFRFSFSLVKKHNCIEKGDHHLVVEMRVAGLDTVFHHCFTDNHKICTFFLSGAPF